MPEGSAADLFVFPASFAQARLWLVDQVTPGQSTYNLPMALRLRGDLDLAALQQSVAWLVARQEALRTTFAVEAGEVMQVVHPSLIVDVELRDFASREDAAGHAREALRAEANRPFDLQRGPLFRCTLFRVGADEHLLLLNIHHIVADGWSTTVVRRELAAGYSAAHERREVDLPELTVQYADYAIWQREQVTGASLTRLEGYWQQQFVEPAPVLDLPVRGFRSATGGSRPAQRAAFRIPAELGERIDRLARGERATPFMAYLAVFQLLLARYAGQQDVIVGTPMSGRAAPELESLVGLFLNTLALRTDLSGNPSFRELLARVRDVTLGAFAHDALPFERVVEIARERREVGETPLVQVMFSLENSRATAAADAGASGFAGLMVEPVGTGLQTAKFDLQFTLAPDPAGYRGSIVYDGDLFDPDTIERMTGHFLTLLCGIADAPDATLVDLPLIEAAERRQLLVEWNGTATDYPREAAIGTIFREQVAATPDAIAVVACDREITYHGLQCEATALVGQLRAAGVGAGAFVAIAADRSIEAIVGMLAILEVGAAYVPLDPQYPAGRLAFILRDTGAPVVLVQAALKELLQQALAVVAEAPDRPTGPSPQLCVLEELLATPFPPSEPAANHGRTPSAESPAYVMYTSGSTGQPKGVVVPHRAVVRLVRNSNVADLGPDQTILAAAPMAFDASTFEIWGALLNGGRVVLAPAGPPDPRELGALIAKHHVTTLWLTSALFQHVVDTAIGGLCGVRQLLAGGDVLSVPHVRRVLAELPDCRLINGYGPTENTTFTCTWLVSRDWPADRAIPIGRPIANTTVYVLDDRMTPVPIGVPGELYAGGDGVALGYHARPELTRSRFVPDPFSAAPGARLYRTGDRVRWNADGVIEFLGRFDNQVKIRGFRIELGEIEAALLAQPGITGAAAVVREDVPGDKRVIAYVVGSGSPASLREQLWQSLPTVMVPTAIVVLDQLPLTSNGKVDRKALPAPDLTTQAHEFIPPTTSTEVAVAAAFVDVLRVTRVGAGDNFFDLGGHSLIAIRIVSRLQERAGSAVTIRMVFEHPTVAGLAAAMDQQSGLAPVAAPMRIAAASRPGPQSSAMASPASFAEVRFWFLASADPDTPTYNVPVGLRLQGALDVAALTRAVTALTARHEALRATYEVQDGVLMRTVHPPGAVPLAISDLSSAPDAAEQGREILRVAGNAPFDLRRGPLARFTLVRVAEQEHLFLIAMHHVIADGASVDVALRDLAEEYAAARAGRAPALPHLTHQYSDYAAWQREQLNGDSLLALDTFWRDTLRGSLPTLDFGTRRKRPAGQGSRPAGRTKLRIPEPLARRVDELAGGQHVTPFMLYLAAFQLLLSRYTGQEDIVVGTPMSGRNAREVEPLVGLFLNTLALRSDLSGDPTFNALLARVRDVTLSAFAHDALPFQRVVELVKPGREQGENPVFQAMFSMTSTASGSDEIGRTAFDGLNVEAIGTTLDTAKFDLQLAITRSRDAARILVIYDASIFEPTVIDTFAAHFLTLLGAVVDAPDLPIGALPLLGAAERERIVAGLNATSVPRSATETLNDLLDAGAAVNPQGIAVVHGTASLTHAELHRRAELLANALSARGVGAGVLVGVCMDRSLDMIVALVGVLKAGAAYVPMDPSFPADRLAFMLADAACPLVLTQQRIADSHLTSVGEDQATEILAVDTQWEQIVATAATAGHRRQAAADDLAYVIFTSGSTGRPKGVEIQHGSVVNFLHSMRREPGLVATDTLVAVTTISFDIAALEIFLPLTVGARIVLAPRDAVLDGRALGHLLDHSGATVMQATPATWRMLVETGWTNPRRIKMLCGGEALPLTLATRLLATGGELWNMYGPTETTIWSAASIVTAGATEGVASIGGPIDNTTLFVLDAHLQLVPFGVVGELYIGGAGLARGYLNRPDLTAEKFIADPFSNAAGSRLYKTGDRVRRRPDGHLEFLGRADQQVKLRGYRIEIGEIESILRQHEAVSEAVVAVREDQPGVQRLVAYVVTVPGSPPQPDWIRHLARALPEYMVPSTVVVLEALPRTPNGKLDRNALPAPGSEALVHTESYFAPRTALEQEIAAVWQELLGVSRVSMHDDFFDLGGNSLLAILMIARVERISGGVLPLRALLDSPTIASIAARLIAETPNDDSCPVPILQAGGAGTPLAFVHGDVLGYGWYCRRLAPLLGAAPLIVLPTYGPQPGSPVSIDAMARGHVQSLRQVQPHGPYRIGGFCAGALIAYEMARQLAAEGETVESVIMVDAFFSNVRVRRLEPLVRFLSRGATEEEILERRAALYDRFRRYTRRVRQMRRKPFAEQVRWAASVVRRKLRRQRAAPARETEPGAATLQPEGLGPTGLFIGRAQRGYMPTPWAGRVQLIWAAGEIGPPPPGPFGGGWELMVSSLESRVVDGKHDDLVLARGLPLLGSAIRASLPADPSIP